MAGHKLILNASIFLGIVSLLLGASSFADPGVIGGSQDPVTAETCVSANDTLSNINCAMTQAEEVTGLIGTGSSEVINAVILIPLSIVISFLVITQIIIPVVRGG